MLLRQIELFLRLTSMPATKFGRLAAGDPRFVLDLRNGRNPRDQTEERIEHFMNTYKPGSYQPVEGRRRGRRPVAIHANPNRANINLCAPQGEHRHAF